MEFGDFQTPKSLADKVVACVKQIFPNPSIIIEPSCGLGSFIEAGMRQFETTTKYYGFDINPSYVNQLKESLKKEETINTDLKVADFFHIDWKTFFNEQTGNVLVIGNPPWVTNSALGSLERESGNLPDKSNFQGLSGLSAKTGQANFDIAEWILIELLESLQKEKSCLAMLCKTTTARRVLKYLWNHQTNFYHSSLHRIDAQAYFNVSVDACLFITHFVKGQCEKTAKVYSDLNFKNPISHIGIYKNELIANLKSYQQFQKIEGIEYYKWRSGIKHDASKVMELSKNNEFYVNGFEEQIEMEDEYIYPLLKSSDLANHQLTPRKYVIITQKNIGEATKTLQEHAPKTWRYLERYSAILSNRKSSIYKNRPEYSIFGIGDYSFSLWKVAISGLYKQLHFSVIGNSKGKPIMLDDTCYFIPCASQAEAIFVCNLFNSEISQNFLNSLVFFDSKRPINQNVLKRIDLKKLAQHYHLEEQASHYFSAH